MAATIDDLKFSLDRIEESVRELLTRIVVSGAQVNVTDLSEITDSIGLAVAGEFRTGQGIPGYGFSGVRMAYPPMLYNNAYWNIAGVQNDVLQFGLSAADGKAYAGGGAVVLDSTGIKLYAGTDYRPEGSINIYDEISGNLGLQFRYSINYLSSGATYLDIGNSGIVADPQALFVQIFGHASEVTEIRLKSYYSTREAQVYALLNSVSASSGIRSIVGSQVAYVEVSSQPASSTVTASGGGATSSDGQMNLGVGYASLTGSALSLKGNTILLENPNLTPDPFTVMTLRGILEVRAFSGLPGTPSGDIYRIHNKFGVPYVRLDSGVGYSLVDPYQVILDLPYSTAYKSAHNQSGTVVVPEINDGGKVLTLSNMSIESVGTQYSGTRKGIPLLIFNGTNARLTRTNAQHFVTTPSHFSIGTWVFLTTINKVNPLFYLGVTTPVVSFSVLANNTVEWRVWNTAQQIVVNPATTLAINTWHFLSGYWRWVSSSDYTVSLNINGTWTDYSGTAPATTARTASGDLRIGNNAGTDWLSGYLHFPHFYYPSNTGREAATEHFRLMRGLLRAA